MKIYLNKFLRVKDEAMSGVQDSEGGPVCRHNSKNKVLFPTKNPWKSPIEIY